MTTKILFFDTNALLKYFVKEPGSEIIRWLCHPTTKLENSLIFNINECVCEEFEKILKYKFERNEISRERLELIKRQFPIFYKKKIFRVIGEHIISNTKLEVSFPEAIKLLKLTTNKNDWDARIYRSICNSLAYLAGPSHPILVTSDKKFLRKVKTQGYRIINPEKHTKAEILNILNENK